MTVNTMNYQAVIREIGEWIIYSEERSLEQYSDVSMLVLAPATECRRLNPQIKPIETHFQGI